MKNANHSSGYYVTNAGFSWHLKSGNFYNRGSGSAFVDGYNNLKNKIYTVIIDVKMKTFLVLLNGYLFGNPQGIELQDEEIALLCPFIDIYDQGDKVSIVDIQNMRIPSFF